MASNVTGYRGSGLRYRESNPIAGSNANSNKPQAQVDKARYRCCGCLDLIKGVGSALGSVVYGNNQAIEGELDLETLKSLGFSDEDIQAQNERLKSAELNKRNNEIENKSNKKPWEDFGITEEEYYAQESLNNQDFRYNNSDNDRYNIGARVGRKLSEAERKGKIFNLGFMPNQLTNEMKGVYDMGEDEEGPILFANIGPLDRQQGIENWSNSCTIASLLFNMFAVTNFFDEFFLVGPDREGDYAKTIRIELIKMVNNLRSTNPIVYQNELKNLRLLVMPEDRYGAELQPHQFLNPLFEKLNIDWEDEFTNYSINFDGIPRQFYDKKINLQYLIKNDEQNREEERKKDPSRAEGCPIIRNDNKVLFINTPRQEIIKNNKDYQKDRPFDVVPCLNINVEGQKYELQSIVANVAHHNFSYVIGDRDVIAHNGRVTKERAVYHFNGGQKPHGAIFMPGLYDLLKNPSANVDRAVRRSFDKLIKDGAFYIYIRK